MSYSAKLFRTKHPYSTEESDELFAKAVRENCDYHYRHCAEYRQILDGEGFKPSDINSYADISRLPFIPTLLYKKHALFSMPERRMFIKATSSGTGGHFSKIGFDLRAALNIFHMGVHIAASRKLISPVPCRCFILSYRPDRKSNIGTSKSIFAYTFFAPAIKRIYALKFKNGQYEADLETVSASILKYRNTHIPVRFLGFPAYMYFLMKALDDRGIRMSLPKRSLIIIIGGWKQYYREKVDKPSFYALAKKVFNIDDKQIVEAYGAVEHPVFYCDCPEHHFHVPVYGRVIIRDVQTLQPVENGRIGLVNLITPMNKATPVLSVMTDDLGVMHDGSECACGRKAPYFEIIGRVGMNEIKTCAAGADEILSKLSSVK